MESPDLPRAPQPQLVIVWRIHDACSLNCGFCGYSRELAWERKSAALAEVLQFGRILGEVQAHPGRSILVSWLGGEPLSWPALVEASRAFQQRFGLRLGVTTNGVPLASRDIRRTLLAHFEQLTVSIDGLQPFHDAVRGQPGLFDQLQHNLAALQQEDTNRQLWRRVNTVLMRDNMGQFAVFAEQMAKWGFHELTFNQLGGVERPEFFARHRLLGWQIDELEQELPALREQMAERGMTISGSERYLHRIRASAANERLAIDDCRPGKDFLFINTEGFISPCSFSSAEYGIHVSEIRSARDFLELPPRFRAERANQRLRACDDCHATHVFDKFERTAQVLDLS